MRSLCRTLLQPIATSPLGITSRSTTRGTLSIFYIRTMATVKDSIPHIERTSADQRQNDMYSASIGRIEQINQNIRLLRLYLDNDQRPLRFLPGQYVDLHIPEIERVGGFTITSPPQTAMRIAAPTPSTTTPPTAATFDDPYIELAIQKSPENPPAAYVWQQPEQIMNAPVRFRIGGNFTFPPMTLSRSEFLAIDNVVLIAGGVGINPIMSMLSAMDMQGAGKPGGLPKRVRVLYSSKTIAQNGKVEEVLFEPRLRAIAERRLQKNDVDFRYAFFNTGEEGVTQGTDDVRVLQRRMTEEDLVEAVGPKSGRSRTLVYVCGLPAMTDSFVAFLQKLPGLSEKRVLCEKWW